MQWIGAERFAQMSNGIVSVLKSVSFSFLFALMHDGRIGNQGPIANEAAIRTTFWSLFADSLLLEYTGSMGYSIVNHMIHNTVLSFI